MNDDLNVSGACNLNDDLTVNGATNLNTNANNDVAIIDAAGVDTMRINDAGEITLHKAAVSLSTSTGAARLCLNTLTNGPIALSRPTRQFACTGL